MKNLIPFIALAAIMGTNVALANEAETSKPAAISTEADYEKDAEARIYIKYYKYLQDNVLSDAGYVIEYVSDYQGRTEAFFAKSPTTGAPPAWNINPSIFKDLAGLIPRVPDWFAADDLKLFKEGLEQMKADTGTLQEISAQFRDYYKYDGPYKADNNKKFAELLPKLTESLERLKKNNIALKKRILELASAGEKRLAEDSETGLVLFAMQEDLAKISELVAPVSNPELIKEGNAIAKDTADKLDALNKAFKEGFAKNAKVTSTELSDDLKKNNERFYRDCASLAKFIDEDIINKLRTKGQISSSNPSSLGGLERNAIGAYNEFVSYYNYEGGFAIKR